MKQKEKEQGLYVSKSKFAKLIAIIVILIVALLVGNIIQLRRNRELKNLSEQMTKQSASLQENNDELEKTLKEKEAEIEELNSSLSIEEDLKTNVNLVKNLRASNENLQKKVEELQASLGENSDDTSNGSNATTETVTVSTTETTTATTVAETETTNSTAASTSDTTSSSTGTTATSEDTTSLVGDKMTKYFHNPACQYVAIINEEDKVTATKAKFEEDGYKACTYCNP